MILEIEDKLIIRKFLTELDSIAWTLEPDCGYEQCLPRLKGMLSITLKDASMEELVVIIKALMMFNFRTTNHQLTTLNRVIPKASELCRNKK